MKLELEPGMADLVANAGEAADFLKKFAHPSRLMIVCALIDGERSVRDLEDTLGIRQPGLSQQIAELRDAGFIVGRRESKSMFYRLADGRVRDFIELMYRMFCTSQSSDPGDVK
ncbi:ArsR/SmtB family transcription factor [Aquamicrobium zhengzhouense]|uniref:Winged helix-turn-helix transcriptional regulator n=1 Tax=Aquamicrobium zhengzhouense TaxID=2781738 RepID=A0ABS0SBC2_9HYPH|nr:metalloregulator ArsR/SmtB family transcription factor [Aquamicrobium zhengzhouense]MBI1620556.1 winged helix-turn-helix transcriptional regulator [Aquamicrobium zhengzhouense]